MDRFPLLLGNTSSKPIFHCYVSLAKLIETFATLASWQQVSAAVAGLTTNLVASLCAWLSASSVFLSCVGCATGQVNDKYTRWLLLNAQLVCLRITESNAMLRRVTMQPLQAELAMSVTESVMAIFPMSCTQR